MATLKQQKYWDSLKGKKTWNKDIKTGPNPTHSLRMTGKKFPSHSGKNHENWKGNNVGLIALHEWMRKQIKEPKCCEECGKEKKLDLANISQEYKRDVSDWEYLCRRCHMIKDGRMERFLSTHRFIGNPYQKRLEKLENER